MRLTGAQVKFIAEYSGGKDVIVKKNYHPDRPNQIRVRLVGDDTQILVMAHGSRWPK